MQYPVVHAVGLTSVVLFGCTREPMPSGVGAPPKVVNATTAASASSSPPSLPPPVSAQAPPSDDVPASVQEERARSALPLEPPPTFTCASTATAPVDIFKGRTAINGTFDAVDSTRVCRGSRDCTAQRPTCLLCPGGKLVVPYTPRDMNVVIGPPDRGVCIGGNNLESSFEAVRNGEVPQDAVCVARANGKEAFTTTPDGCRWLAAWTRFLREERALSEGYLQSHIRVSSWDLAGGGDSIMFTLHYALTFDWATVSMNDAFEVRVRGGGPPRTESDFLGELRAHRLTGSNEPHAWQLRPIKAIVSRAQAAAKIGKCPGVTGPLSDRRTLGDAGEPIVTTTGVVDRRGRCAAATVNLETGAVSCGVVVCAVY